MNLIKNFELQYEKYFKTNLKSRFVFVPHAHIKYSGFCAFVALNYIDWKNTKEIFLISTNHFSSENITPKNSIKYDNFTIDPFDSNLLKKVSREVLNKEHSWNFLIPLFKHFSLKSSNLSIKLILLSNYDTNLSKEIVDKIQNSFTSLIVNSDLTHINGRFDYKLYGSNKEIFEKIRIADSQSLHPLLRLSKNDVHETACGSIPIKQMINILSNKILLKNGTVPKLVCYYNSCQEELINTLSKHNSFEPKLLFDIPNNLTVNDSCVGYGSIVYLPRSINNNLKNLFSPYEQYYMTSYCYKHLYLMLKNNKFKKIPFCINFNNLEVKKGLFITINKNNNLRGCIGTLQNNDTIFNNLSKFTYNTAFNDSRFSPIKLSEFPSLQLYISILDYPPKEVSYNEYINNYKIGHDGIEIKKNGMSAFFLPSVGEDIRIENPNIKDYDLKIKLLELLCRKAGLHNSDCYKKNTTFVVYKGYKLLFY